MQIWFYKAEYGDWCDKFISWGTGGPYSHVELVFSDGECFTSSPRDGGVRFKTIPLSDKWTVIDIGNKEKEAAVKECCRKQLGKKYDWLGAFGCGIGLSWLTSEDKWFCSEIVGFILNNMQLKQLPTMPTPNAMYQELLDSQ